MIPYANQQPKEKHPSGTHEYLQKHAISGCWKGVEGEDGSALMVGNGELAVKNIRVTRVASAEKQTGSDSTITVDVCHVDKEVEIRASAPKDKAIERVESRETTVDTSDNTAADVSGESDNSAVAVLHESDYPVLEQSDHARVDSLGNPYNGTLDTDGELDETMAELGKSDSMTVDAVGESNNKTLDVLVEADKATDVLGESVAIDVRDAAEVDPTTFDYDMMDLDTAEGKNSVEVDGVEMFGGGDSIEAAATLSTLSQHNIPPSFDNLGGWQVVNRPRTPLPDGRERWGAAKSKLSTRIDRKELLDGWDWVFQKK